MIQLQFLSNVRFYYKNLSLDKTLLYNSIQHLQYYNFICQFKSHRLSRGIVFLRHSYPANRLTIPINAKNRILN